MLLHGDREQVPTDLGDRTRCPLWWQDGRRWMKRKPRRGEVSGMTHVTRALHVNMAACLVAGIVSCSSGDHTTDVPPSEPPVKMVTVSVGVANAEVMTYTDPASPDGVTTVSTTDGDGRWGVKSVEVTVPAGTTVRVQAKGASPIGASCWITDRAGQLKLTEGTDACSTVAE